MNAFCEQSIEDNGIYVDYRCSVCKWESGGHKVLLILKYHAGIGRIFTHKDVFGKELVYTLAKVAQENPKQMITFRFHLATSNVI